ARHADALGLTGFSPRRDGTEIDASSITCAGLDAQVARLGQLTADRPQPLQALVQWIELTSRRQEALERAAAALELPLEWVADSPYVLVGTADEIATTLHEHRERFGLNRWTLFVDKPGAPPVEELAALVER